MDFIKSIVYLGIAVSCIDGARLKFEIGRRITNSTSRVSTILGGAEAAKNDYPWQIAMKHRGSFICGGSVLNKNTILTAGHCVDFDLKQTKSLFEVVAGEHNTRRSEGTEQRVLVDSISLHSGYNGQELLNDIALLHLKQDLNFTTSVQPVNLSTSAFDRQSVTSKTCFASGFGVFTQSQWSGDSLPSVLQELNVNLISNGACNKNLKQFRYNVSRTMICSNNGEKGICSGDSGGPVGCFDNNGKYIQVGIVSWGPKEACNIPPAVYTRVSRYIKWINRQIRVVERKQKREQKRQQKKSNAKSKGNRGFSIKINAATS